MTDAGRRTHSGVCHSDMGVMENSASASYTPAEILLAGATSNSVRSGRLYRIRLRRARLVVTKAWGKLSKWVLVRRGPSLKLANVLGLSGCLQSAVAAYNV